MSVFSVPAARSVSRRQFLRVGVMGGLALSAVSGVALLSGCSTVPAARGFRFLRESDVVVLNALLPVLLAGALPEGEARAGAVSATVKTVDALVFGSSRAGQKQIAQLFDLLSLPATRYAVAGLHDDWPQASAQDINAFLQRWSQSRFQMLRAAYLGLCQIGNMAWYLQPRSWAAIGYEPPRLVA